MTALRAAAVVALLALSTGTPSAHSRRTESWPVKESRTRTETIPLDGARKLLVDDLYGKLEIRGYDGDEIRMTVAETLHARDREAADLARKEAALEVSRDAGGIVICADGPFREPGDCTEWRHHCSFERDYKVVYDLTIEVPRGVDLKARTVEGDIDVSNVKGRFEVTGVNGSVTLAGMDGSGEARSVNGPLHVAFDENPSEDCSFDTVNGDIDVTFRAGLSADMTFKTMNGKVLTDFDYETLPPSPVRIETESGGTKYRMDATSGIRIASGGPRFEFENINGDILVRKSQ